MKTVMQIKLPSVSDLLYRTEVYKAKKLNLYCFSSVKAITGYLINYGKTLKIMRKFSGIYAEKCVDYAEKTMYYTDI